MADVEAVNGVAASSIEAINGVAKASIQTLGGFTVPSGGVTASGNLVHWWKFDESSGATAADSGSAAATGTAMTHDSAPTFVANGNRTSSEYVIKYDGSTELSYTKLSTENVALPGGLTPVGTALMSSAFSITFWIKRETANFVNWELVFQGGTRGDWSDGLGLYFHDGTGNDHPDGSSGESALWFWTSTEDSADNYLGTTAGSDTWPNRARVAIANDVDGWQHVAITHGGGAQKIYLNGSAGTHHSGTGLVDPALYRDETDHSSVGTSPHDPPSRNLVFGAALEHSNEPNERYHMSYSLSDLRIYNKALSAAEVTAVASTSTVDWP